MTGASPLATNAAPPTLGLHRRLELDETLAALVADGVITDADAKRVRNDVRTARGRTELHPLVLVANLKLPDQRNADKPLSLEVLNLLNEEEYSFYGFENRANTLNKPGRQFILGIRGQF